AVAVHVDEMRRRQTAVAGRARRRHHMRGGEEGAAGRDLELLAHLRDDAPGRRDAAHLLPARMLRGRARPQIEAAAVVGPRTALASRIEEAPAWKQREQVEVGVLF